MHKGLASALVAGVLLAGCAGSQNQASTGINDPFESQNRTAHSFNLAVDEALFKARPGHPRSVNNLFVRSVSNVGSNLGLPSMIVNSILQGRPEPAVKNTFRFLINSTIGIGGIFDPAGSSFSLPESSTDFGETLAVWGAGEGAYVELPIFGPSTERDAVGTLVDLTLNPAGNLLAGADAVAASTARVAGKIADRKRFGETVESILYDSADSYAQSRLIYLQNRRYQLSGQENSDVDAWDPYEDPYAE